MNDAIDTSCPAYPPRSGKDPRRWIPRAVIPNIVHLSGLLTVLAECGQALFRKLMQADAVVPERVSLYYGGSELPVIIRYLLRGLFRADALMQVLLRRARRGDVKEWSPPKPGNRKPPGEAGKRDPNQAPKQPPKPPEGDVPFADCIPSQKELLAWARGRNIGVAIADICRDLAVLREELPPEHWREIERTINRFGGNAVKLFHDICDRLLPLSAAASRKYGRKRRAEPAPEPAAPATPRVLISIGALLETFDGFRQPPGRRTSVFA